MTVAVETLGRTCLTCGEFKRWDDFPLGKGANGRRGHCKPCHSRANSSYNKQHRDKADAATRAWRSRNTEVVAEQKRAWRLANPDKVRRHKQNEYERHREKIIARVQSWAKENPEKRKNQHHVRRSRLLGAAGSDYTTGDHIKARFALYGGKCFYCGSEAKAVDHRIPLARGGSHWPSNLVPACTRCNSRKNAKHPLEFRKEVSPVPHANRH